MINDEGDTVDLYIPRKWWGSKDAKVVIRTAYTNKLITAKDHAAVQINIGHLNENGQYVDGNFTTFALAGNVRAMGQGDSALDTLWKKKAEAISQQ